MKKMPFTKSTAGSIGVELEIQIINPKSFTLVSRSKVLLDELQLIQRFLIKQAQEVVILFSGGAHSFQRGALQKIFPTMRYKHLSSQFRYLSKRSTLFGQHIHIVTSYFNTAKLNHMQDSSNLMNQCSDSLRASLISQMTRYIKT